MKIISKLALNQIRLNRKRTMGTILAIALSTSLVTAVMCFVTSGNKMLTDFLGTRYGGYESAYSLLIVVPAIILGLLIAIMSVMVISNIFTASANKRIQEFGIVKCVGGTKKQIKKIVVYESMWLSGIGIPLGLLLGTLIGYIGVSITGHYVDNINELGQSIIMRPFTYSLSFYISGWTYLFASVFSLIIVFLSANKPAKSVGRITAINCIKGLAANKEMKSAETNDKVIEAILGCEGVIAYKNIKRNKSAYKATIRALSLGILLLLMTGGLAGQAKDFRAWMDPESKEIMVDYISIRDYETNEKTKREQEKIVAPISYDTYNEIAQKLSKYPGIEVYGIGSDECTYNALLDKNSLTKEMLDVPKVFDEYSETEVSVISVDEKLYRKLCGRAEAPYGSNLLVNSYQYNDNGRIKKIKPFKNGIDKIILTDASEKTVQMKIGGMLSRDDLNEKGFLDKAPTPVRIVVPHADARYFDWYCSPENEEDYTKYARNVLDEYYPILTEDSYVEQGYTVRISRTDVMIRMLNLAIVLAEVIMYGFVILLMVMGLTSVISTLVTNIRIRGREFAVLKSIGMTNASLRKMVYSESMICILRASISGIIFGIAIPFVINLSIRRLVPVLYHIPWGVLIMGIALIYGMVMLITFIELAKLKNQSIVEEIKMDVM